MELFLSPSFTLGNALIFSCFPNDKFVEAWSSVKLYKSLFKFLMLLWLIYNGLMPAVFFLVEVSVFLDISPTKSVNLALPIGFYLIILRVEEFFICLVAGGSSIDFW